MKVVLLQDVQDLGKKYDIKEVKIGFARNFLFPRGLAQPVTKNMLKKIEEIKVQEAKRAEEVLVDVQKLASRLDGQEIEFLVKIGQQGQLFEAITALKISKTLREMGFDIKKEQIVLVEPLKEIGEFPVKINLDHQLEAKILVIIEAEEDKKTEEE